MLPGCATTGQQPASRAAAEYKCGQRGAMVPTDVAGCPGVWPHGQPVGSSGQARSRVSYVTPKPLRGCESNNGIFVKQVNHYNNYK